MGRAALHSPRTAITDYTAVARSFARDVVDSGGEVRLGFPVTSVTRLDGGGIEAVRQVLEKGKRVTDVARKFEITRGLLYRWIELHRAELGSGSSEKRPEPK